MSISQVIWSTRKLPDVLLYKYQGTILPQRRLNPNSTGRAFYEANKDKYVAEEIFIDCKTKGTLSRGPHFNFGASGTKKKYNE